MKKLICPISQGLDGTNGVIGGTTQKNSRTQKKSLGTVCDFAIF
jgi:hypothetical protein